MLSVDTRELLRAALANMASPVRLICVTGPGGGAGSSEGVRLARDMASLSDRITVEELDLEGDRDAAAAYRINLAPTIAVVGNRDRGLRFTGVPGGYEIMTLADAILLASAGGSGLSAASRARLAAVRTPLDILVFVTPT